MPYKENTATIELIKEHESLVRKLDLLNMELRNRFWYRSLTKESERYIMYKVGSIEDMDSE